MKPSVARAVMAAPVLLFDYFGVLAHRYGRLDEEMIDFIRTELAGKYRLAVLSNMNSGSIEDMLGPSAELFDEVMISGELGVAKPDQRAFLLAASRLGEFPGDCLMIDDSLANCTAAVGAGMLSLHYQTVDNLRQQLAAYGIITS